MSQEFSNIKYCFHEVHGNDVLLTQGATTARRMENKDNGLIFLSKPIKPYHTTAIKFLEISNIFPGVISVGFTSHDPATLKNEIPKNTKAEIKRKPGFWMCSLSKHVCVINSVLFFYVSSSGRIHYGVNGKEVGHVEKNVITRQQLWPLIYLWAPQTAVTLVGRLTRLDTGDNLRLNKIRIREARQVKETSPNKYLFTTKPIELNQVVKIFFLKNDSLVLGVTSCNPKYLSQELLPEDPELLLDRSEYWVVLADPSFQFKRDDEVTYTVRPNGEMKLWKNSSLLLKVIHVDSSLKLWGYFRTSKVDSIELTTSTVEATDSGAVSEESICTVCCDKEIDTALYPCGHMCMCFECGTKQWRGVGLCILCRAKIQDVLKVYKS